MNIDKLVIDYSVRKADGTYFNCGSVTLSENALLDMVKKQVLEDFEGSFQQANGRVVDENSFYVSKLKVS